MNEPFFSVLIPVYNTEKTLTRCIRSVSGLKKLYWLVKPHPDDVRRKLLSEKKKEEK